MDIEKIEKTSILERFLSDKTFIESVEFTDGKLSKLYPDWRRNKVVFEFLNGSKKECNIDFILNTIKSMNYKVND